MTLLIRKPLFIFLKNTEKVLRCRIRTVGSNGLLRFSSCCASLMQQLFETLTGEQRFTKENGSKVARGGWGSTEDINFKAQRSLHIHKQLDKRTGLMRDPQNVRISRVAWRGRITAVARIGCFIIRGSQEEQLTLTLTLPLV